MKMNNDSFLDLDKEILCLTKIIMMNKWYDSFYTTILLNINSRLSLDVQY